MTDRSNFSRAAELDDVAIALGILIAKYPAFRFFHAPVGQRDCRWIAERINGSDPGLRELLEVLALDRGTRGFR